MEKWPIEIDGLPLNSMVIFHGYVSHNQMVFHTIPRPIIRLFASATRVLGAAALFGGRAPPPSAACFLAVEIYQKTQGFKPES